MNVRGTAMTGLEFFKKAKSSRAKRRPPPLEIRQNFEKKKRGGVLAFIQRGKLSALKSLRGACRLRRP